VTPAEIIRMEANFLQFPFFALDTHGLKEHDGLTCTAERQIGDERHEVSVRITRNNAYAFPGPLSRKIHFALLAKLQEEQKHPPFRNPIQWSWYDLAERIGLKRCSGGDIRQMKDAIESTHAAYIKTRYSLSHTDEPAAALRKRENGYHLYERLVFMDDSLPDGSTADTNHLWLSDWYLANLNSHYCGPLDYGRWLYLNNDSRIASRLYEYLTYNFSAGMPVFRIRYDRLAQFLPVRVFASLSRARQQLEPALKLLQRQRIIDDFRFERGANGDLLIVFQPGVVLKPPEQRLLRSSDETPSFGTDHETDAAASLVCAFYEQWIGSADVTPSPKELELASEQLKQHGDQTLELLPVVVKLLKEQFPEAQRFGATRTYWPQAVLRHEKQRTRQASAHRQAEAEQQQEESRSAEQARKQRLRSEWQELSAEKRQQIVAVVREQADSEYVRRSIEQGKLDDPLVELACLTQLERA